ncbi:hypothetical protein Tco_1048335 [Tanacetum coccineum]
MLEPSEEPFNVTYVSREVMSQPFAEKKVAAEKPTGLGAPPAGPILTGDTFEKLLSIAETGKKHIIVVIADEVYVHLACGANPCADGFYTEALGMKLLRQKDIQE